MAHLDLWNKFLGSGAINDYLVFKAESVGQEEADGAGSDKGNRDSLKEHG